MEKYVPRRELLEAVEQVLADKPRMGRRGRRLTEDRETAERPLPGRPGALDDVARLLQRSRRYFHVAVYLNGGPRLVRQAASGAISKCFQMDFGQGVVGKVGQTGRTRVVPDVAAEADYHKILPQTRSELVVPIKIGTRVLGVIDVESDRLNAFAYPERVLLSQVAQRLTKFLVRRGKYLLLEARETVADHLRPRYESHPKARHSAAAGDRSRS